MAEPLTYLEALKRGHPFRRYPLELNGETFYVTKRRCIKELYSQLDLAKGAMRQYQGEAAGRERNMSGSIAGLQRARATDAKEIQRLTDRLTETSTELATEKTSNRSLQGDNLSLRADIARANQR